MIKLSNRLATIASFVPVNSGVMDIGCDHALLDIYMYQKEISKNIIATDINENALRNANDNIKKYKLTKSIKTRLGNGLDTLNSNDDIDTIIMSGMGAHTIIGILKKNYVKLKKIKTIIIQSNTKLDFLRNEIAKLNYMIDDELIVVDNNKMYTIIKFIKGNRRYNRKELYFGPILLKNKDANFIKYNQQELSKLKVLLRIMPKGHIIDKYKIKKKIRLYKGITE